MKYFVTGSNGFIGSNIVKRLDNWERLEAGNFHTLRFCKEPYQVIHCAAYGNHFTQRNANLIQLVNIDDTIKLLGFINDNCVKFYNFSTSSVHLKHQTLYSISKMYIEKYIEQLNDPRIVNIRPYSVYGPNEAPHRFIPTVIRALKTGQTIPLAETAKHDWIFVDDFIDAMFAGHRSIGTGVSYTNLDVVNMLQNITGKKLNYAKVENLRDYDTDNWVCPTPVKARSLFEGLKLCV